VIAMAFSRGHAAVEEHAHTAPAPDRVTAG
jgi:hypothetical protein